MAIEIRTTAEENLRFIRGAMERAQRTSSVSGASGIVIGLIALGSAAAAAGASTLSDQLLIWITAAIFAAVAGLLGTWLKARRLQEIILNDPGRRFLLCLLPMLATGALLTLALWQTPQQLLLPAFWMLLYGCGLTAAGTYAAKPILPMGICFLCIGLLAWLLAGRWSNLLLGAAFGGLHIIFGYQVYRHHGG